MPSKIIDNTNAGIYEKMRVPGRCTSPKAMQSADCQRITNQADTKPLQKITTNVCIAP